MLKKKEKNILQFCPGNVCQVDCTILFATVIDLLAYVSCLLNNNDVINVRNNAAKILLNIIISISK